MALVEPYFGAVDDSENYSNGARAGPVEVKSVQEAYELISSEECFGAVGEFIFKFSQLEYLI